MTIKSPSVEFRTWKNGQAMRIASISLAKNLHFFQQQAMRWRYIVRQRSRWSTNEESRANIETLAAQTLVQLGITRKQLTELAENRSSTRLEEPDVLAKRLIEISIPWRSEAEDWCARIMPWEYMLSAATKAYRSGERKIVVRRLIAPWVNAQPISERSYSILEAAPGIFREQYDFESERALIRSSLSTIKFDDLHRACGRNPSLNQLKHWIQSHRPHLLHVTGVDGQTGAEILGHELQTNVNGLFLSKTGNTEELIGADAFAAAISSSDYHPDLVAYNVWHSGTHLAPLSIVSGAQAALGFENTFDDSVSELFFAQFYTYLDSHGWNLGLAFERALRAIEPYRERIRGSGIMLWTQASLLQNPPRKTNRPTVQPKFRTADPDLDRGQDFVRVEVNVADRLNYAHLHNRGSLLNSLSIQLMGNLTAEAASSGNDAEEGKSQRRGNVSRVENIDVEVTLNTGVESYAYQTRVQLTESERIIDLGKPWLQANENHPAGGIFVPLTSERMRSIDEAMLASIHVGVSWHGQLLYNRSFAVRLAPVDEWRFEENQIIWMSSFVQPRDDAVAKVIDSAQRYLACLADNLSAGFGGYQAYDPDAQDPWSGVDVQVQAIWAAITLDYGLGYINPPPSYSENAQRLRTPSRVFDEGRGTCVDLALMFAACLEWIEIYPVLFLLNDHALPGYWRNPVAYKKFQREPTMDWGPSSHTDEPTNATRRKSYPAWYAPQSTYRELRQFISPERRAREGDTTYEARRSLIPLESVMLTQRVGFRSAVEKGRGYFANPENQTFYAMIDVPSSRTWVTPIPMNARRS